MDCELKLVGGSVVDGTGAASRPADVAVDGGKISAIGDLGALDAETTVDATGKTVTPGFIDIHSHSDFLVPGADHGALVEPFVRQGMTTLVTGNCGFSPAPVTDHNRSPLADASVLLADGRLDLRWSDMGGFLDALDEGGVALNVAQLVGHGTVRAGVMSYLDPSVPDAEQLAAMERMTKTALDQGCVGVSTGLGYPPGIFSAEQELTTVASWAASRQKLFTSHLKAYSCVSPVYQSDPLERPHNIEAIEEILRVAEGAGVRLQISHLIFVGRNTWPTHERALELVEQRRAAGLDVAFDAFPYTAGNTTAAVLFPPELLPRLEAVLESDEEMANLKAFADFAFASIGFDLGDIQIMQANAAEYDQYNGLFIDEAAAKAGVDVWTFYARLVLASHRAARVLLHNYSGASDDEQALRAVLAHPLCTIETDTCLTEHGHQNPASYGTFPRVLSTYVDAGLFTFEEAVRKMTGAAAERLGWTDRGVVREGAVADLVVLDGAGLADTATFERPDSAPRGIEQVYIGGRRILDGADYDAAALAGTVIRA